MLLFTNELTKIYGEGDTSVNALKSVNINIEKGEQVSIIGASGSGKSTLLHLLGGLDYPSEGTVFINDIDIYKLKEKELTVFRRQNIGFIFQYYNLVSSVTVYNNIVLPLLIDGRSVDREYTEYVIEKLGIIAKKDLYPGQLSGGQQQRVAIARALITKPQIILADEPTGNLDKKTTDEVMRLIVDVGKEFNQTIVVITHDTDVANRLKRKIEIEDGMIVKDEVIIK